MIPKVESVEIVDDFLLLVRFEEGVEGLVDLRDELDGEIFEPLRDPTFYAKVQVHPEFRTLVWPNGADFAPEFLYDRVRAVTP